MKNQIYFVSLLFLFSNIIIFPQHEGDGKSKVQSLCEISKSPITELIALEEKIERYTTGEGKGKERYFKPVAKSESEGNLKQKASDAQFLRMQSLPRSQSVSPTVLALMAHNLDKQRPGQASADVLRRSPKTVQSPKSAQ